MPHDWQTLPGLSHGRGLEAQRGRTQPRPEQCRRQSPEAEARPVAGLRSRRLHRGRRHQRQPAPRLAPRHGDALRARRAPPRPASRCWSPPATMATPGSSCAASSRSSLPSRASAAAAPCRPPDGTSASISVSGSLHLPPGHRLIAVLGADEAPDSWFERWGLWSVFGIALVVVFVYWMTGLVPAAIAALALLLTYQEMPPLIWLWGNLLAALAIARAAPEGRFRRIAQRLSHREFRGAGTGAAALHVDAGALCAVSAARELEARFELRGPARNRCADSTAPAAAKMRMTSAPADECQRLPAQPSPRANVASFSKALGATVRGADSFGTASIPQQVVQRYASGTRLQAGPGIPAWHYNTYLYRWSGPVEAADSVRFLYIGPIALFFWRILGVDRRWRCCSCGWRD